MSGSINVLRVIISFITDLKSLDLRPLHKAFEKLAYCTMRMQYKMVYRPYPPSCKIRILPMASLKSPNEHAFGPGSLHLVRQRSRNLDVRPAISAQSC